MSPLVVIIIVALLLVTYSPVKEGIPNYNQIRSDYTWTDHYDMQFDDIHDRPVDYHYADLDTFLPKPAFGRTRQQKKINKCSPV